MTLVGADRSGAVEHKSAAEMTELLTPIWERVLQRSPIDPGSSFFELGGNDVLADVMFAEISQVYGREVPSATICHAPTIRELAEVLDQPAIPQFPPFIQLKAGNEKPPVFIAHGLGGRAKFWGLVQHIYTDRAIYGIHAKGIDGIETPFERIEDMAKYYRDALYEFQPQGPYILVGYSFGGLVALEMAQRMYEDGKEVALLVLVDTYPHPHFLPPGRRVALLAKRTKRHFVEMKQRSLRGAWEYFVRGLANRLHIQRLSLAVAPGRSEGSPEPSRLSFARTTLQIRKSDLKSLKYYRPRYYPGTIKFVRPETNAYFPNEPEAVWKKLAARLEVDTIPGDHLGVILTGYEDLASVLTRYLKELL